MAAPIGATVMWTSTVASIPSGYSRETALDGKFPKMVPNTSTNPGATGGGAHTHSEAAHSHTASNHTHGGTTGNQSATTTTANPSAGAFTPTHNHTYTTGSTADAPTSNSGTSGASSQTEPAHIRPIYIKCTDQSDLPNACWALVNTTTPTGWTFQTNGANKFLRGATAAADGAETSQGADTHTHTYGHTHQGSSHSHTNPANVDQNAPSNSSAGGGGHIAHDHTMTGSTSAATHTWNANSPTSGSTDHKPPYFTLDTIKRTTAGGDTPVNIIVIWTGTIASIPLNWAICDGNNGTPNLLDKFVRGSASSGSFGSTGGAATHTHNSGSWSHTHNLTGATHTNSGTTSGPTNVTGGNAAGTGQTASTTGHTHAYGTIGDGSVNSNSTSATISTNDGRPAWYEVAYIMKTTANTVPSISAQPSATYANSKTRTGPNTTWGVTFTANDSEQTGANALSWQIRTSNTLGATGGTQVTTGTATAGASKVVTGLAYNLSGLVDGDNTLYLHVYDGEFWVVSSSFTLKRDPSITNPSSISYTPNPVVGTPQYSVTFTNTDTYSTTTNEMIWEVRTASGGGGSQVSTGTFTQGSGISTGTFTDAGLVTGTNARYLRTHDGADNIGETLFNVDAVTAMTAPEFSTGIVTDVVIEQDQIAQQNSFMLADLVARNSTQYPILSIPVKTQRTLQWRQGGKVRSVRTIEWRQGGKVRQSRTLQWSVAPSPNRIAWALDGRFGSVAYSFRFEKRTSANLFLEDVTESIREASIDLNNDRDVLRTAKFVMDPNAIRSNGTIISINPLKDYIAVIMDLVVDGNYILPIQMGLFSLTLPTQTYKPNDWTSWEVEAADLGVRLAQASTPTPYTVASGANYISGTNGVKDIVLAQGLRHNLPATSKTLPVAMTWAPGTPWIRIVNDLLHGINFYNCWADTEGRITSRERQDLYSSSENVEYTQDDFIVPPFQVKPNESTIPNQVIAIVDDPSRGVLYSSKSNNDLDSPVSIPNLGRTVSRVINAEYSADQTTLDSIAAQYLRDAASLYNTGSLTTQIDPRRDAHEVYKITIDDIEVEEKWWARNWKIELKTGALMEHEIAKTAKVVVS